MKRKILKMLTAFSFAAVLTTSFSAVGVANAKNEQSDEISCAAKSAYVLDFDTGTVVYAKNENEKLPIASMTKSNPGKPTSIRLFRARNPNITKSTS